MSLQNVSDLITRGKAKLVPAAVQEALGLPLKPLALLGIGKPAEQVFLIPAKAGDSLDYYRKDGGHFVPKLGVEDLLLK